MIDLSLPASFLLAFLPPMLVVLAVTPAVMALSHRLGMVAQPRADRWHKKPTPLLGGVPIYVAIAATVAIFAVERRELLGLLGATTAMFLLGLWDDFRPLRPYVKLIGQIVVACGLVAGGLTVGASLGIAALPLTVLWVIGITNAFNLLDNMDGLAAGAAAIVALVLFVHSLVVGDAVTAIVSLGVAGATLAFLVYNFNPARIFMGDSGSLAIGVTLSGLALMGGGHSTSNVLAPLLIPVGIMAVPILDTALVTLLRAGSRRPVMQGGRDHLSHRLVALGLSERQAVIALYIVCGLGGALAVASNFLDVWATVALAAMIILGVGLFGAFLADVRMYPEERYRRAHSAGEVSGRPTVSGIRMYKRQSVEVLLDFLLACLAYLTAYLLKFEASFAHDALNQFATSLPYVVAAKMVALLGLGVYRPVWRYAGSRDLARIALASAIGTALAAAMVMLLFQFLHYSRSVFVIDWLVFTALLGGARLSFPVLGDIIGAMARKGGRRMLIVGADDLGEVVLRTMLRNPSRAYLPVGFLDDDPGKHRRQIHGIPILGTIADLPDIVQSRGVQEVILALPGGTASFSETVEHCIASEVPYRDASSFLGLSLAVPSHTC